MVNSIEDLKNFNPSIRNGIIFDDPEFSYIGREKLIALFDNDSRDIAIRYKNIHIYSDTIKAVTANNSIIGLNKNFDEKKYNFCQIKRL